MITDVSCMKVSTGNASLGKAMSIYGGYFCPERNGQGKKQYIMKERGYEPKVCKEVGSENFPDPSPPGTLLNAIALTHIW